MSAEPEVVSLEPGLETTVAPPAPVVEEVKEEHHEPEVPLAAPEEAVPAPVSGIETTTHEPVAETPAEHTEETPATEGDAKATEDKSAAVQDKVEKTKAEAKGFFARLFGPREKSPKKEKKVKTPKTEKHDPIAAAAPAETVEPVVAAPEAPAPVVEEPAPVTAVAVPATEEVAAEPVVENVEANGVHEAETAPETPAKDEPPKLSKANRRLSARITSAFKGFGKKEHPTPTKEDAPHEVPATEGEEPAAVVVSEEAPQLAPPVEAAPLEMEETVPSAPPAAPEVATTA